MVGWARRSRYSKAEYRKDSEMLEISGRLAGLTCDKGDAGSGAVKRDVEVGVDVVDVVAVEMVDARDGAGLWVRL